MLLLGDIGLFLFALWLTLFIRYSELPAQAVWNEHLLPFAILFAVWIFVFFIAGLYEKHTLILRNRLPSTLLQVQMINSALAVIFFYFIPYFNIAPKTNLFLYIIISSALIFAWRVYGVGILGFRKKQKAILIGSGEEMIELKKEVNNNSRYNLSFTTSIDLNKLDGLDFEKEVLGRIYSENIKTIVIDLKNEKVEPILSKLYNLIFSHVHFIDKYKVYEDIFDRVPLSLVGYSWFLENISGSSRAGYDILKRAMDITASVLLWVPSLIVYPFVYIAIKLDDDGPVFYSSVRVGQNGRRIKLLKFRSMKTSSSGSGVEDETSVTRVGSFIRKTRIDELPQLYNVLKGDMSLVGPRPETPKLVDLYEKEIPYYNIRHLIKPGLSGWAQIYHEKHPHMSADVLETKVKLSFDLFYIKNRSFSLDVKIALKTVKTLLSRAGK